jgi:hypothetical protein
MYPRFAIGVLRDGTDGAEGGGGTPAFDPTKFRTDLMAEVTRNINGAMARLEKLVKPKDAPKPPEGDDPDAGDQDGGDGKPVKADPRYRALEKRLADKSAKFEQSEKARQETEQKARTERLNSTLRTELLKHVPAERIDAAMRIFGPDVRYSEEGSIVGGADESPLGDFVNAEISKHEYLLPPKPVGGAGASSGSRRSAQAVGLDDIRPGMSAEQKAAILASIRAAYGQPS